MSDQTFVYGEMKSLRGCRFSRENHDFIGWYRAGTLDVFSDGAIVSNLTSEADDVVTLTARWKPRTEEVFAPVNVVGIVSTNVVMHYVVNSIDPALSVPVSEDTGIVNVVTEVKSGGAVGVPETWAANYPTFVTQYGNDFVKALMKPTGKRDGSGSEMLVWQDYVAGTDPTNPDDKFVASVTMVGDHPVVSWSPELSAEESAKRVYKTYGKAKLQDVEWEEVSPGCEADYNFFKVTVEMR